MTGKLSKNFHGVGIGPLSKISAVKYILVILDGKVKFTIYFFNPESKETYLDIPQTESK